MKSAVIKERAADKVTIEYYSIYGVRLLPLDGAYRIQVLAGKKIADLDYILLGSFSNYKLVERICDILAYHIATDTKQVLDLEAVYNQAKNDIVGKTQNFTR